MCPSGFSRANAMAGGSRQACSEVPRGRLGGRWLETALPFLASFLAAALPFLASFLGADLLFLASFLAPTSPLVGPSLAPAPVVRPYGLMK